MQANHDYERQQFNTVVSGSMKLFNELSSYEICTDIDKQQIVQGLSILLRLLAPITPHITHHLWSALGFEKIIIDAPWPKVDKSALKVETVNYIVQVNGKLKGQFQTSIETTDEDLIKLAKQHISQEQHKAFHKAIVVNHRHLINLVIK